MVVRGRITQDGVKLMFAERIDRSMKDIPVEELKEKLGKTNELLDKLDEMLAVGEITEAKYKELKEKYRVETDSLKNQMAEKVLKQEFGIKTEEEERLRREKEDERNGITGKSIGKLIVYGIVGIFALIIISAIIAAFVFGMGTPTETNTISSKATPLPTSILTPSPTATATPTLTATATAIATPVRSDYLIPTTNLPAGFTYMGIHETPVEIGSFSINATEGVYRNNGEDFYILVIKNDDPEALITQYKARYKNARYDPFKEISFNGHKATQVTDYSTINGKQTQNFAVIWATEKTMIIVNSPTADIQTVIALATATPTPTATPGKFRVGPSVTLRPVTEVIAANSDGIVEFGMNNPSLNDVMLNVVVRIAVPSGIRVYGQGFEAAGAGVVAGMFSVPPGTQRTIAVVVKADTSALIGSHTLQFTGLYLPGNNEDASQPLKLTYSVTVKAASKNPESPEPSTPTVTAIPVIKVTAIPVIYRIEIRGFAFNPQTITITKGTTVTWINEDSATHTVTGNAFITEILNQGQTFSYTFDEAGTFDYWCKIHPSMRGKVVVT